MTSPLKKYLPHKLFCQLRALKHQRRQSISQFGQDFWVFGEVFNEKKNGFFLEIGAADGVTISNTLLLEKRYNWSGISIEANPESYREMTCVRRVKCLNLCVDDVEKEVEFLPNGLMGGIVDATTDLRDEVGKNRDVIRIKTRSLKTILDEHKAPRVIDYFSIDVEGAEERILASFPFSDYRFVSMTVERPKEDLRRVLAANGYVLTKEIPGYDCFYIHQSFLSQYAENALKFWSQYRT